MRSTIKHLAIIAIIIASFVSLNSCKKTSDFEAKKQHADNKTFFPVTTEEKKTVEEIMKVTEIIKKVYAASPKAVKEINGLIKSGYYNDQFILLKDVLQPQSSALYLSQKTNSVEHKGSFKQAFINELNQTNTLARSSDGESYLEEYLHNSITIYFPYADLFEEPDPRNITVVPADRDGDAAPGYILRESGEWERIEASDEYSVSNPCHLIGVTTEDITPASDDIERAVDDAVYGSETARCSITYSGTPENELPEPPTPELGLEADLRIAIGYSRCVHQYDAWISFTGNGGGSEIRYSRGDGYLKFVDDHVTDFQGITSVQHSRSDIRNRRALYVKALWDFGWEKENFTQYFALWEEDTRGQVSFKFNLTTTVTFSTGNTGGGGIEFNFTKKSQDEIITQFIMKRDQYLATARDQRYTEHGYVVGFDLLRFRWPCSADLAYKYDYTFLDRGECPWPKFNWAEQSGVGWTWPYKKF